MTTSTSSTSLGSSNGTYDPTSTATALAQAYTADQQTSITNDTATATATANALTTLNNALTAFDTSVTNLSSQSSILANTATFSDTTVGSATADPTAVAGSYSFFVQQLATAGQVSYSGLSNTTAAGSGNLTVTLADGNSFSIDLASADTNHDGTLSPQEIAAAINVAAQNNSQVTASTLNVNGSTTLVLTSNATGAQNAASLDTSGVTNATLKAALDGGQKTLVTAQDAIAWVGPQNTGTEIQQASNTFNVVSGVAMTFTKAQTAGDAPVTLTVGTDSTTTAANVQSFVTAFNTLQGVLNTLTSEGNPTNSVAAGPFADDSGLLALQSQLNNLVRTSVGGQSLVNYGISGQTDGTLTLDTTRLAKAVAANPTGLNNIFGNATLGNETGVLGNIDTLMNQWTNAATGVIVERQSAVTAQQKSIADRQTDLDNQYNDAYARYLAEFTALQTLQSQMTSNTNLFTALFGSSSSS